MRKYILMLALCVTMLANAVCANAAVTFDLAGQIGSEVSSVKINNLKPFVEKAKFDEPQFYLEDEPVEPVVRIRFDEGEGSTVTEEVSGKELTITGSDYEWIDNADIRYGGTASNKYKQHSALRLNSSYINLGDLSALSDSMNDGFTLIYWTNYEIFNKADNGYEEPAHLQYSGSITRGNYEAAYKYDQNRYNVILQSDNTKIGMKKRAIAVNDTTVTGPEPVMYNDFYNMYIIVVDKNDSGEWTMSLHGNDRVLVTANKTSTLTDWDPETVFSGNLYIGTPDADTTYGSPQLGIADLMIFDRPLTYQERLEIFYGYKQTGYYLDGVPTN